MNLEDVAHTRLHNLQLSRTTFTDPAAIVAWMGALQAQDYAAAKWSLGLRLRPTSDDAMEQAFNEDAILRTHMMRPTWHFVHPDDIRWILALTSPRVHQVNGTMYRQLELDEAIFVRSADIMTAALRDGHQLTRDALGDVLEASGIQARKIRLAYIVMWAELEALICSGPRHGKQFTYMLLDERARQGRSLAGDEALVELVQRYYQSHGPATEQDFARWSGLTLADTRRGLDAAGSSYHHEEIDGQVYWHSNESLPAREASPKVYLLSIFDEYTIGYKDRSAIGELRIGSALSAMGNALRYVVVLDSQLVGTWRRTQGTDTVSVELTLLQAVTSSEQQAIVQAADVYSAFDGRPIEISHHHN